MGPLEQPFNPSQVALTSVGEPNGSPAVKPKMSLDQGISLGSAIWQPIKDIINFYQTKKENERNRAFAEQQATTAYERQKELWRMEKQYESPAAQMQRYLQAGLNPNLIYGNVSAPGSPAAAPMGNAANQSAPQLQGDPFGAYLQSEYIQEQIERLKTQNLNDTHMTNAQVASLLGDTPLVRANINHINQLTQNLVQQYNLNSVDELASLVQFQHASNDSVAIAVYIQNPETGEMEYLRDSTPYQDFEQSVLNIMHYELKASEHEAELAFMSYLQDIGLLEVRSERFRQELKRLELENADLAAFVKVAASYYRGMSDEQSAIGSLAQGDKSFYERFGSRACFNAMSSIVGGTMDMVSGLVSKRMPKRIISQSTNTNTNRNYSRSRATVTRQ